MIRIYAVYLLSLFCLGKLSAQQKPNILVIYTDDHRYTGVHTLGGQAVQTPHLDQLIADGIAFTNTYLMGAFSGATCVPSRAMLLTGRDLFSLDGVGHRIPPSHKTLGETLMQAGYHAHHVGKWHQDLPSLARSFQSGEKLCGKPKYLTDQYRMPFSDWQADGNYQVENCYLLGYDDSGKTVRRSINSTDTKGPIGTESTGPHVSEVLANEAVDFLQDYQKDQPFFMYLAFTAPHDPRQAPQKYKDLYPKSEMILPPSYRAQHPFDNGHIVLRDELLAPFPRTPETIRKHLSDYYAIITHLDTQIGRVISALKKQDLYNKTIIVVAGDSGLAVGNHGLLGKQNIYDEDGIHVPLIFSGKMLYPTDKGRRIDALNYIHDIMPTICDLVDVPIPETVKGKSLVPVIKKETAQIREDGYYAYRQHQRAYRKGDYKLIEYVRAPDPSKAIISGSRVTQLFNTAKDPWETFNLADYPEYQLKVTTMRSAMEQRAKALGDTADGHRTKVDFWKYWDNFSPTANVNQVYNILDYGAVRSHKKLSTKAIQAAIDDCANNGGGTVLVPKGTYVTGTLFLKSNVTLKMGENTELFGSSNLEDYAEVPLATEEPHFSKCLFYAKGEKNITIVGHPRSEINGKGYLFKHSPERPKLFRIEECTNVRFENAIIKNSGSWCAYFRECDSVFLHKTAVYNKENRNNDGMNFDGCSNVRITDCNLQVEDDAICLKSSVDKICENIHVENCTISSYWASVKFGTASKTGFRNVKVTNCQFFDSRHGAIKLLAVDGAILEDVEFSNIKMYNCGGPIFLRLGNRGRTYDKSIKQVYDTDAKPEGRPVGKIRNITFKNIEGRLTGRIDPPTEGIMFTGLPNHYIENVTLENIHFSYTGFGNLGVSNRTIAEDEARYPEQLFFGVLPAYGMYLRHIKGLKIKNVNLSLRGHDDRYAIVMEDVLSSHFEDLTFDIKKEATSAVMISNSQDLTFKHLKAKGTTDYLLEIQGTDTKNIQLIASESEKLPYKSVAKFSKGATAQSLIEK
ncbi:MAG: sulfatase-like hydrolase/transferase [Bacteroidota bacterium]